MNDWDSDDIQYIRSSFKLFSELKCLSLIDREQCLKIFRLASFLEAVSLISFSCASTRDIRTELCDKLMTIMRCKQMTSNFEKKYSRHLIFLETVCERPHRLKKFRKKSSRYLKNLSSKLRKRAVPLLESFIENM
ncbi:unnamed protein product [Auanema sp. JU1783]|nr:unnamed protein product [Auanema sp. JU1783]